MSLITCTESECIDKILTDYNENVVSRKDYYFWANQKYQHLTSMLKNPENSRIVYKALNFVTYLSLESEATKRFKNEKNWNDFSDYNREAIRRNMIKEFDPERKEKKSINRQLLEIKQGKTGRS